MDIRLPKLGEGAESGTVVTILVKEGERVEKGQTLIELENEKAVAPIPAPVSGTVAKLRVKEGDKISVGHVIAVVEEGAEATEAKKAPPKAQSAQPRRTEEPEPQEPADIPSEAATDDGTVPAAAPSIRKLARELDIDLRRIHGSERGGRIVMADVRAYIQRLQRLASAAQPGKAAAPVPTPVLERIDFSKWGEVTKKPMPPIRQTISRRLWESWNSIPHVTQFDSADITVLNELRKKHAPAFEKKGARLTLTSFALKIVAEVLRKHPIFNSSLDEAAHEIVFKQYIHIGVAVDTDQGLLVPVLRDVDKKDLVQLSKELNDSAEKARARKLSLEEMQGGSFTISNQGGIGGAHFTPIINRPEVAILGLGRGALQPAVRDGRIEPRLMMPLGLSYDHRVIDGGSAARFVTDLAQAFQNFGDKDIAAAFK
jgi:pyruvate dehydrogenase E2 component (dihydrolipoamide acetyltransferase)